jgi:Uma2 family endonuclease
MSSANSLEDPLAPPLSIHRFTIEQYHQMGEAGVLTAEDRVELLEGLIVEKMNQRPIHGFIVGVLNEWLQQKLPPGWIVRCQLPVTTDRSEPEPDLAILKGAHADFRDKHPVGSNCRLVIEVADASLDKDRAKATIYRESGVAEYWIINVPDKLLERYHFSATQPHESQIAESQTLDATGAVSLKIADTDLVLELKEVLG